MLSYISEERRQVMGILDPEAPVIRISIVIQDGDAEVMITPGDNGCYSEEIGNLIRSNLDGLPNGTHIYHICFGEQTRIASEQMDVARALLRRFGRSTMGPIDSLTELLTGLPNKEKFEQVVRDGLLKGAMAEAVQGRALNIDNLRPVAICSFCGGRARSEENEQEGDCGAKKQDDGMKGLYLYALGIHHNHPFFTFFTQLVEEATNTVMHAVWPGVIKDVLVKMAEARVGLEAMVS